jgi:hypothetical protein
MISKIAGRKEGPMPGRDSRRAPGWILTALLTAGFPGLVLSAEVHAGFEPCGIPAQERTVQCGKCRIAVLGTYVSRDWMPIVSNPGPDGGSPLYVRTKLTLDNSAGDATELALRAAIVDSKGKSYPISFGTRPGSRPFAGDISKSRSTSNAAKDSTVVAVRSESWDGRLNRGEVREIELAAGDGPYLPAGSRVRVWMEWTDTMGNTAVITTPDVPIERTD